MPFYSFNCLNNEEINKTSISLNIKETAALSLRIVNRAFEPIKLNWQFVYNLICTL